MLAGAQFVATWVLHDEQAVTLLFVALIAPAVLVTPLWQLVARRVGKERGFVVASAIFVVAALVMIGLVWAPGPWVYAPVALAGAAYAGMQSLPMAMLPDVIAHDARRTGLDRAGSFGGVWTAGETAGMALGATVLTIVLALTGYLESTAGASVTQPASAVAGIAVAFSAVPAVLVALSVVVMRGYRLRRADIDGGPEDVTAADAGRPAAAPTTHDERTPR
jgi:GPH family glycoside/pentoside/hexuronide:cation symporter